MSDKRHTEQNGNAYLDEVQKLIKDMKYGSLTLVVQDGKVIQIDKIEKHRL